MEEWLDRVLWLIVLGAVAVVRWRLKADIERSVDKKFREWEVRFSTFHGRLVEAMEVIRRAVAEASEAVDTYQKLAYFSTRDMLGTELRSVQRTLRDARLEFEARSFYFDPVARGSIQGVFDGLAETERQVSLTLSAEARGDGDLAEQRRRTAELASSGLEKAKESLDHQFRVLAGGGPEGKERGREGPHS